MQKSNDFKATDGDFDSGSNETGPQDDGEESYTPPPGIRPKISITLHTEPGTSAFIPRNLLQSPKLTTLATRLKMMPAQQAANTEALVCEIVDDPERICTSYAYTEKNRRSTNVKTAEAIRREWQPAAIFEFTLGF